MRIFLFLATLLSLALTSVATEADRLLPASEIAAGKLDSEGNATNHGDWQPVLRFDAPADGDEWTLYVRYKGGAIQAKGVVDGQQHELDWSWSAPPDFEWIRVGRYKRAEIRDGLLVIGGAGARPVVSHAALISDRSQTPETLGQGKTAPAKADVSTDSSGKTTVKIDTVIPLSAYAAGKLVTDELAFSGKAVTQDREWNPLARVPLPESGEEFFVFVRSRKGPLCGKMLAGDSQKEIAWIWDSSPAFSWKFLGRVSRSDSPDGVMLIRADSNQPAPEADAIMYRSDENGTPETLRDYREPELPPVVFKADWNSPGKRIDGKFYGLNLFSGIVPGIVKNPAYAHNLAFMAPGLVRLHSMNMMNPNHPGCWLDETGKTWDREKIAEVMANLDFGKAEAILNICHIPGWMKKTGDGLLDPSEYRNYAEFCAELVRIVNLELKAGIKYWEITNEWDDAYWVRPAAENRPGQAEALAEIFRMAAHAMKQVDPTIKTGGLAAARADKIAEQRAFAAAALPELDFYSFHIYASGSDKDSDRQILYDRIDAFSAHSREIRQFLNELSPGRRIEAFLDEFNISWTWEVRDRRMTNSCSAVFDALVIWKAIDADLDGTAAWNECDGVYGKMDNGYALRPSAFLYHLLNRYAVGDAVKMSGSSPDVAAFGVRSEEGRTIVWINRSSNPQTVETLLPFEGEVKGFRISENGFEVMDLKNPITQLRLPMGSVTLLTDIPR